MLIMRSGKRYMTEEIELSNQDKIRTLGEKETHKYLGVWEADTIKRGVTKKTKNQFLRKKEKDTRNQIILQESYQRDKHLDCSS